MFSFDVIDAYVDMIDSINGYCLRVMGALENCRKG
jgi:hypothetical protein